MTKNDLTREDIAVYEEYRSMLHCSYKTAKIGKYWKSLSPLAVAQIYAVGVGDYSLLEKARETVREQNIRSEAQRVVSTLLGSSKITPITPNTCKEILEKAMKILQKS